jgi:hypothetical protein
MNFPILPALAFFPLLGQIIPVMEPPINTEENIGKAVDGPDTEFNNVWTQAMELQRAANELRKSTTGRGLCPKGVFKFKTHEEADAWMDEMLALRSRPKD